MLGHAEQLLSRAKLMLSHAKPFPSKAELMLANAEPFPSRAELMLSDAERVLSSDDRYLLESLVSVQPPKELRDVFNS